MAIKKYFVTSPKPGYQYDRNAKKYFSYGFDLRIGGKRIQERGFLTKADAEAAVANLKAHEKSGRHGIYSPGHAPYLIELLQRHLDTMAGSDRVRAKRVFSCFLELLPKNIKVTELKTAHLQLYVERRQKDTDARTGEPISNQTIHRELVPIVTALKKAKRYFESLDEYRYPEVPRPKIAKDRKERVISEGEQGKLFTYFFAPRGADEDRRTFEVRRRTGQFLLFCLLTLSRPGEVAALRRTDVDMQAMTVAIHGTKTRFKSTQTVRRLAVTPTMAEIVRERLESTEGEFLFTSGGYVTPRMYGQLKKACEENGLRYGRSDRAGISFHTARHTGITMLLQAGVDLKTVGRIAGQSDARMTLYYTHSSPGLVNEASRILERKMGKGAGKFMHRGE